MTEDQFRVLCGRDSDPEIADALSEYFRSIGWHDTVTLLRNTSFSDERPDYEGEIEEAKQEGWEEGVKASAKAIEDSEMSKPVIKKAVAVITDLIVLA